VLRLASVLGQTFDLDVLLAATEGTEAQILDHLDAAVGARLLEEQRGARVERYGFVHALIRQSLYGDLPGHKLRRLHQRAGEALEALRSGRPEAWGELARHFGRGIEPSRGLRYSIQAGDHAAGLHAHAEAADYYQTALELVLEGGELRQAAQLQRRLGDELHELNRRADALASYEAALATYRRLGDAVGQAQLHRDIAWIHQARSEFAAAQPHLESALRLWPPEADEAEFILLLADTARLKVYTLALKEAGRLAERGLALAEQLGEPRLLAPALMEAALARRQMGAGRAEVLPMLGRAEATASLWCPKLLNRLYAYRGSIFWAAGDITVALADFRRSVAAAEQVGQPGAAAWHSCMLAWMEMQAGHWAAARAAAQRALTLDPGALADRGGWPGLLMDSGPARASGAPAYSAAAGGDAWPGEQPEGRPAPIPWLDGKHDRALDLMRDSISQARARGDSLILFVGLWGLADALLQLDRVVEAAAPAREAVSLVRDNGYWGRGAFAYGTAAEALVRLGAPDSEQLLGEAEERIHANDQAMARPALLRARGILARRDNDLTAALTAFQASATEARAAGSLIQLGRTLAVLADTARVAGEEQVRQEVDTERIGLIERIGPEVQRLRWAAVVDTS